MSPPQDEESEFFDDAKKFWESISGRKSGDDAGLPFSDGNEEMSFGDKSEGFGDVLDGVDVSSLFDLDEYHIGGELAALYYSDSLQDAIEYVKAAPPGVLKINMTEEEIEIWRYPS